ncbi:MAG: hypothetical protein RML73_01020 [Anaerolineae bacterium]|nr:hypothetical protein [Anaerolineae bacterium]
MEQWEYLTCFLQAEVNSKEAREFIEGRFKKRAKRYSPESLIPELNQLGAAGWELIHMQPVQRVGKQDDVLMGGNYVWSSSYFCVFKRRLPGAAVPTVAVMPTAPILTPPIDDSIPLRAASSSTDAAAPAPSPTAPLDEAALPPAPNDSAAPVGQP